MMNTSKMLNCFHIIILKEYRILKFLFSVFGIYLIVEEFYTFIVKKPTFTSLEKRELEPSDFPEILVCPEQSFDLDALKYVGYGKPSKYFEGSLINHEKQFNWAGKKAENIENVKKTMNQISTLKSSKDCPFSQRAVFKNSTWWPRDKMKFKLYRGLYPYHKCLILIALKLFRGLRTFQYQIQ